MIAKWKNHYLHYRRARYLQT